MATVTLRLAPRPAHVRTARLVASAMARRSGVPEELLDDVRLAVGEACGWAVRLHEQCAVDIPVTLELTDGPAFTVVVTGCLSGAEGRPPARHAAGSDGDMSDGSVVAESTLTVATEAQEVVSTRDVLIVQSVQDNPDARDEELGEPGRLALAILRSVVDDLRVERGEDSTRLRMSWLVSEQA